MRVFVTGASGFVGSALVPELIDAGHEVVGLARSDESAAAIEAAGAQVRRGGLDDLDSLRAGAADADAVVHLAFIHNFDDFATSIAADQAAIDAMGEVLAGTDRAFSIASGLAGMAAGRVITERDLPDPEEHGRADSARATLALADRGVRSSVVRLAPTVHGEGDHGFIARLVGIDRDKGSSGYVGDGTQRWAAVHRFDAARLFRLAIEKAPAGSVLHGTGEDGVAMRDVAEVIGHGLDLPVTSIAADDAMDHFGWLGRFLAADMPASSQLTRELLGWEPTHPGLLADVEAYYLG